MKSVIFKNIQFCFFKFLLLVYHIFMQARNFLYDKELIKQKRLNGFVISVGGISFGGQGKTPLTLYIARFLKDRGIKICILSRGYKRKTRGVVIASDGKGKIEHPEKIGDEPFLLASNLKDVPVVIARNRYEGGILAEKLFKPEVFVLDDGFQHRQLKRDLDIVIVGSYENTISGLLREPFSNIKRADIVFISKVDSILNRDELENRIKKCTDSCIFGFKITPEKFVSKNEKLSIKELKGKRLFIFLSICILFIPIRIYAQELNLSEGASSLIKEMADKRLQLSLIHI